MIYCKILAQNFQEISEMKLVDVLMKKGKVSQKKNIHNIIPSSKIISLQLTIRTSSSSAKDFLIFFSLLWTACRWNAPKHTFCENKRVPVC